MAIAFARRHIVTVLPSTTSAVELTERAKSRVAQILAKKGFENAGAMVLGTKSGGGCKGLTYSIDFVEKPPPRFIAVAPRVYVPPDQLTNLLGLHLDWVDTDIESKFVFNNINATSTCNCGKSFSL